MDFFAYIDQRNKLLSGSYDYDALADLALSAGSVPPPAAIAEAVFHKSRLAWTECPEALQEESRSWLKERGYSVP